MSTITDTEPLTVTSYETAADRYCQALDWLKTAEAQAEHIVEEAYAAYYAAEADLRRHEKQPGIPLDQCNYHLNPDGTPDTLAELRERS